MARFSRTRIAPTPSGFLHIGNVFSFALTAALAAETGAEILLRIDDIDRERVRPEFVEDIFQTIGFLEIPWHSGPASAEDFHLHFSQQLRLPLYGSALEKLVATNKIYACDCSRSEIHSRYNGIYPGTCRHKQIPLGTPGVSWRIDTDGAPKIRIKTLNGIEAAQFPDAMQHFVVRKKDGSPAYQLASVVDDLHFGIDLAVRGQDLWASTLAQLFLADLLGAAAFSNVTFFHHQLLSENGIKLSKSAGSTSIRFLRQAGLSPKEIYATIGAHAGIAAHTWRDFARLLPGNRF